MGLNDAQTPSPAGQASPPRQSSPPSLARDIERRLHRGLQLILGGTALVIVLGLFAFFWTDRAYTGLVAQASQGQAMVVSLNDATLAEVLHTRAYLITGDAQSLTSRALAHADFENALQALQAALPSLPATAAASLDTMAALHQEYEVLADEMVALRGSGENQAAVALFDQGSDPIVLRLLAARRTLRADLDQALIAASQQYSRRTELIIGLVTGLLGLCLVGGAWAAQRHVSAPLAALDYFERALVETAQASSPRPVRLPQAPDRQPSPLFDAYNTLADRLAESGTARFEFAARLAHDLRSPLATISGYAALLESQPPGPGGEAPGAYARVITAQTQRMLRTLDQMVMTAQIEENQLPVLLAPLRLDAFLQVLIPELAAHHQRPLRLDGPPLNAVVEADAGLLRDAFANLIDNAIKYSPPEAAISVELCPAERPGWVQVNIIDHGAGIEAAGRSRLFRPFARLYNQAARGPAGSGLGLYITRHIVERHGGAIELESRPGEGTVASVALPLLRAV